MPHDRRSIRLRLALAAALAAGAVVGPAPAAAQGAPAAAPAAAPRPAAAVYEIDRAHSELRFRIRHLVSRVSGTFNRWEGTITVADPTRWEGAAIEVSIEAASIDTQHERRDADLRSDSFFDAENHPTITFRSTRIERRGDAATIHGTLTMRGVTRPVVLEGSFLGSTRTAQGKQRVGFEARTTIDRLDYGITWNRVAEGGGVTLGDEVQIELTVAAVER
jgi:polyisoprenoid-binding protein YceI